MKSLSLWHFLFILFYNVLPSVCKQIFQPLFESTNCIRIIQNPFFGSISMPEISYTEQIIFVWLTWPSLTPLLLTSSSVSAQHCSGHWSDHPSVGRRSGSGSDLRCRAPESRTPASGDIGERWAPGWGGADMQTPRTVNIVMNIYSCSPDPLKTNPNPDIRPNTALGLKRNWF